MRAEVGLLSRNLVYRGDPETSSTNKHGAHIMMHSPGSESIVGRFSYAEFTGISSPYEEPINPELSVDTGTASLEECVDQVINTLKERGIISS